MIFTVRLGEFVNLNGKRIFITFCIPVTT